MCERDDTDLRGKEFERADLSGARLSAVSFNESRFQGCEFRHVEMRGVELVDTTISGEIRNLVINGVDVAPLIAAELDRRHPDLPTFRPTTADGFREAWDLNERLWAATVDRARRLPAERLHESVDGEWSFIQTLRHLAFASESWVARCVLGDPAPWHPLSLPWDELEPTPGVPHDRPDEGATSEVRECLSVVLNEEWWHRMYAERDLAVLEERG